MKKSLIQDQTFAKIAFAEQFSYPNEFDNCQFSGCNFASTDLSENEFNDCTFRGCDVSLAIIKNCTFRDVRFEECKLLGLHFHTCNKFLFSASFDRCVVNLSSFYQLNLKNSSFKASSLREVDFSECNLTQARFDECDLADALFDRTNLEKADLRTAINFRIDPDNNRIRKARFSVEGALSLLAKYSIDIE